MSKIYIFFLILAATLSINAIEIFTAKNYYTNEETIQLFWVDNTDNVDSLQIAGKSFTAKDIKSYRKSIRAIEIAIDKVQQQEDVVVYKGNEVETIQVEIKKLPHKLNAVKMDRIRGCVIADDMIYMPSGFYTYSPVQPFLLEDEVVRGFNMVSPYQKILPKTRKQRLDYLNQAHNLGMKVNYNLLSVAGGGGVNLKDHDFSDLEKTFKMLKDEVKAIKDHPALLSWYISDEPYYTGTKPEYLEQIYKMIKEIDPYHPVTIVFMKSSQAHKYRKALDIAMADPYPIPVKSVYEVEQVTHKLANEFFPERLVWNVPQTFGGSEWWRREPTPNELRSMLYLSLLNGSSGYQFFIRKGLNGFPKSTQLWSEGSRAMLEMQEIVPWLFSEEENPEVSDGTVKITSKAYRKDNSIIIISVNGENKPVPLTLKMTEFINGKAEVLFENRSVKVVNGVINDNLDVFGVKICKIYTKDKPKLPRITDETFLNHSFERNYVASVPSGCYANVGKGRGKIYSIDSRDATDGEHSLRMHVSPEAESFNLNFYPIKMDNGRSYYASLKARKGIHTFKKTTTRTITPGFFARLFGAKEKVFKNSINQRSSFKFRIGKLSSSEQFLNQNWTKFSFIINNNQESKQVGRISPRLIYNGPGTAWFDEYEILPLLKLCSNNEEEARVITTTYASAEVPLFYTLDGSEPTKNSPTFSDTLIITESSTLKLKAIGSNIVAGTAQQRFAIHSALDCVATSKAKISTKFSGDGLKSLTDGLLANDNSYDYRNVGFESDEIVLDIKLKKLMEIDNVAMSLVSEKNKGIYFPTEVQVEYSADGKEFKNFHAVKIMLENSITFNKVHLQLDEDDITAQHIRIKLSSDNKRENTITILDEIIINN